MHAHELRKLGVIDASGRCQRLGDGGIDVKVAAFEDRPRTGVTLEQGDF